MSKRTFRMAQQSEDTKSPSFVNKAFVIEPEISNELQYKAHQKDLFSEEVKPSQPACPKPVKMSLPEEQGCLPRLKRFTWLLPLIYAHFWSSAAFTLIQSFYPALAASADIEAWRYGFVFSAFKMSMMLGSLLAERLIVRGFPLQAYLCGQLGYFLFLVAFGSLYWCPGGNSLLASSLVMVILGGTVRNMYLVTMYSIVIFKFPQHTGVVIAMVDFTFGCGNMFGSITGGVLIDAWAYPLPFYVMGCIMILSFPVVIKYRGIFSQDPKVTLGQPQEQAVTSDVKLYQLLWRPPFLIDLVTLMLSWVIMGFNEPTLEPHLAQFNLTSTQVGLVFMTQFVSYAVGALLSGIFCYFKMETFYAFVGQSAAVVAYIILGPAPFVPGSAKLWMVYLSQVFIGLGMPAQYICSFCHASKYALSQGHPCNIQTSSFISACVLCFMIFGGVIMPPIAGYLVESFGYRTATMFLFGLLLAWAPVTFFHWVCRPKMSKDV